MKSLAIKLTSEKIREELINEFEQINLKDFYLSSGNFKNFKNVIVHYSGNEIITFFSLISDAIANVIQKEYDSLLIDKIISKNYFYIMPDEQKTIKRIANKILTVSREDENFSKEILKNLIYEYISENKKMILEGFVNFRIKSAHVLQKQLNNIQKMSISIIQKKN